MGHAGPYVGGGAVSVRLSIFTRHLPLLFLFFLVLVLLLSLDLLNDSGGNSVQITLTVLGDSPTTMPVCSSTPIFSNDWQILR